MLAGVLPSFEMLMTRWEKLAKDMPKLKKYIQPGLDSAYEYYSRMDETNAYVIAMCMFPPFIINVFINYLLSCQPQCSSHMDPKQLGL